MALEMAVVFDTETTGTGEDDQVVEVALVTVVQAGRGKGRRWQVCQPRQSLVRPAVPVKVGARATHHLTDEELAGAPSAADLREAGFLSPLGVMPASGRVNTAADPSAVVVAHSLEFDDRLLAQSGCPIPPEVPRACTWRVAKHLWPESEGFSNQFLRYQHQVQVPPISDLPPHRALPDAVVTAALVAHGLNIGWWTLEDMVRLTATPILLHRCPFAKHKGVLWRDVPSSYMQWILTCNDPPFAEEVRYTCQHWLGERKKEGRI